MNEKRLSEFVDKVWDTSILPALQEYVAIPNKSPMFDPQWESHGYMEQAAQLASKWCEARDIPGATVELCRLEGRTPLLFIDIPGSDEDTVLLYGHLDKQPEFTGWEEGLSPWTPVLRDGKLYGRGGADDGYAVFSSLTAIEALQAQGIAHARCVVIIEFCEESGSFDLPYHIDALGDRIGTPSLVVCLDAECGNYDQMWCTTSLRGNLVGTLSIDVLREGVHSGAASGIVPSSFRVLRALLDRLEDPLSGRIVLQELHDPIPEQRQQQAAAAAQTLGNTVHEKFPWAGNTGPIHEDLTKLLLDNTWGPTLCVTGAAGIPELGNAGNVMRPNTTVKLSFRLPPSTDAQAVAKKVKTVLESDPPYGAQVQFNVESAMAGWTAPILAPWLEQAMQSASERYFDAPAMYMGTGGSIPFMGMLGEKFPGVQFLVTGVLGPKSNAHGPNEFLHLKTARALTCCVASVIADHLTRDTG